MLLSDLAEDVLRTIFAQILLHRHGIADGMNLASTSRRLRDVYAPVLFSRCVATCYGGKGIPPESIRPFVQHLIYIGRLVPEFEDTFGLELPHLPQLHIITFRGHNLCEMPWSAFKRCLSLPNIKSLRFEPTTSYLGIHPAPSSEIGTLPLALTNLSYNPDIWRLLYSDLFTAIPSPDANEPPHSTSPLVIESFSLSPVLLRVHGSLQSLTLPIEIAPLDRMVRLPWPQLRELRLSGQCPCDATESLLREFILTLPRLAILSVQLARLKGSQGRLSIMDSVPQHNIPLVLTSLTLSYPDPDDPIFSIDIRSLRQLSLSDQPRYYYHLAPRFPEVARRWSAPILSPAECLSVLRRMELPNLHELELVYEVDGDHDDDKLLEHISRSYPGLEHLELHRYRKNRSQLVPHVRIGRILASATSLRTADLNLDFPEEVQLYSEDMAHRSRFRHMRDARGAELASILEACPSLEYVAFLTHGLDLSFWIQYHPRRCAEPRIHPRQGLGPPLRWVFLHMGNLPERLPPGTDFARQIQIWNERYCPFRACPLPSAWAPSSPRRCSLSSCRLPVASIARCTAYLVQYVGS